MRGRIALGLLVASIPAGYAVARSVVNREFNPAFELAGRPVGRGQPARATAAHLTASRIAAVGEGALAIDADSGALLRTDLGGRLVAHLAIGPNAGLLAYDPTAKLAYVADRQGDRVAVVTVGDDGLAITASWKTPAEPYGVALSPDRKTLLVTTIADRTLVAFDTATGATRWRTALGREPRGLAISPDGTRALVAYLTTGTVDQIELGGAHRAEHIALATTVAPRRNRTGMDSFARAAFAVTFLGEHQAVVPFQRETPVQQRGESERTGSYGGGFEAPVSHHLAFLGLAHDTPVQATAQIAQHQPRALVWDGQRDALYVAGLGSDAILQVKQASSPAIEEGLTTSLRIAGALRCGPDGLAITASGDVLVWCAFSRRVARVEASEVTQGPTLVATRMTSDQHAGMVLFHASDAATAQRGAMACSTCHPDNRADGLSWRIDQHELQTPVLSGRLVNTHPYKWDGGDKDLATSLTMTMKRLGGSGLGPTGTAQLEAYVSMLPSVRAPTREPAAVARGKRLFDSAEVGCRTCHDGATYTDQARHTLAGTLAESDTPSLLGLAAGAPYFHDGSAVTLEAVLRDRGAVHGMSSARLDDKQLADLIAFLETL